MADVNGINQNQEVRFGQVVDTESKPQPAVQPQPNSVVTTKVDSTGVGTQVQTGTNFNLYGADITNFEKFKGNDKHDALRITTTAANDVKRAYMQLQHEFPDAAIAFEPMPDPKTCGKKREGFFNYQMLLENWKNEALQKIADARETSTRDMGNEIMANDDKNAAMNAGVTVGVGQAVMENDNVNTALLSQQLEEGKAEVLEQIKDSEGNIRQAIKTSEGKIVGVVRNAQGKIIKVIGFAEGRAHRHLIATERRVHEHIDEADARSEFRDMLTNWHIDDSEQNIKNNTHEEADRTINTLDPTGLRRGASHVRDRFSR